jgi:C-terminal processing protease CtpA/Prc
MTRRLALAHLAVTALLGLTARAAHAQAPEPSAPRRGIGVALQGDDNGVQVANVMPGSPAEKAGLKVGDLMVSVAGISIFDMDQEKMRALADTAKVIPVVVVRDGQKMTFEVAPGPLPAQNPPPGAGAPAPRPER